MEFRGLNWGFDVATSLKMGWLDMIPQNMAINKKTQINSINGLHSKIKTVNKQVSLLIQE